MVLTSSASSTKHTVRPPYDPPDNAPPRLMSCPITGSDRIAEYDMKLMDIDADTLGIPDTDYDACVTMTASGVAASVTPSNHSSPKNDDASHALARARYR